MEIFSLLAEIIHKNGLPFVLIVLFLALLVGLGLLAFRWADKKIENMKFGSQEYTQQELFNHALFQSIRKNISYDIHNLVIGERLREAIFRDFLKYVFAAFRDEFTHFLERGDLNKMDRALYKTRLIDTINNITTNYQSRALQEGIPEIVVERFTEWHSGRIQMAYDYMNDFCDSENLFQSNVARTKIVFDFFTHLLNLTIVDARKTLISLIGQLNPVVYKGITSEK